MCCEAHVADGTTLTLWKVKSLKAYFIYDGDCAFCQRTSEKISGLNPTFNLATSQTSSPLFIKHNVDPHISEKVAIWISAEGKVKYGPHAISAALKEGNFLRRILGNLIDLKMLKLPTQFVYGKVAQKRKLIWCHSDSCAIATNSEKKSNEECADVLIRVYIIFQFVLPASLFLLRCPPVNKTLLYGWGWQMFS